MTTSPDTLPALLVAVAQLLNISSPLVALDLESTGTNPELDRIVELTIVRVEPTLQVQQLHTLVNPGIRIPAEASAIHGITDEHVQTAPRFVRIAPEVLSLLAGADVLGYNHRRFDMRMLATEIAAAGYESNPCEGARLVDVGLIFMKREPRTLSAALQFFCGEAHEDAHGTDADVVATLRVLLGQFERYPDLPRTVAELDAIGRDPSFIDRDGKIVWRGGHACIGFGKYAGVALRDCDSGFLSWILAKDFPTDTKQIVREALRGRYPTAPPLATPAAEAIA